MCGLISRPSELGAFSLTPSAGIAKHGEPREHHGVGFRLRNRGYDGADVRGGSEIIPRENDSVIQTEVEVVVDKGGSHERAARPREDAVASRTQAIHREDISRCRIERGVRIRRVANFHPARRAGDEYKPGIPQTRTRTERPQPIESRGIGEADILRIRRRHRQTDDQYGHQPLHHLFHTKPPWLRLGESETYEDHSKQKVPRFTRKGNAADLLQVGGAFCLILFFS